MKLAERRLAKLELRFASAREDAPAVAARAEAFARGLEEASAKAETDDDGPDGTRARALRSLIAGMEQEAAKAEARRAAGRRTP